MATDRSYIEYVTEQLCALGVGTKKMFGEYCLYLAGKAVALVCDDTVFVKILPCTTELLGGSCETGYPYDGAKLHYVLDIDNRELSEAVLTALAETLPAPK